MKFFLSYFLESNLHNFNLCLIAIVTLNVQMLNSALCLQSLCAHGCSEYGQTLSTVPESLPEMDPGKSGGEIIIARALLFSTFTA